MRIVLGLALALAVAQAARAADIEAGKAMATTACAACHGADGKGNQAIGAPNLTDKIWLHGRGEEAIVAMVTKGKTSVMPAHEGRHAPARQEQRAGHRHRHG